MSGTFFKIKKPSTLKPQKKPLIANTLFSHETLNEFIEMYGAMKDERKRQEVSEECLKIGTVQKVVYQML